MRPESSYEEVVEKKAKHYSFPNKPKITVCDIKNYANSIDAAVRAESAAHCTIRRHDVDCS